MSSKPQLVIVAHAPEALVQVCGVGMLERLLRVAQRLGWTQAIVLTDTPAEIERELARRSWPRAALRVQLRPINGAATFSNLDGDDALVLCGSCYFDPRLIEALAARPKSTALTDGGSTCGAFLLTREFIARQPPDRVLMQAAAQALQLAEVAPLELSELPSFVVAMRRNVRPVWFPAPNESTRSAAEAQLVDAAQKGTMELVSYAETPLENLLLRLIWRTPITPMQVTVFGLIVAALATVAFYQGHLWLGALIAATVGVIDGVDGKLARVKVETTEIGGWEAEMDYPLQMSWWVALAFYFARTVAASHALTWVAAFLIADWIDKIFTRAVKVKTGRYIDNFAPIDRFLRFIVGGRSLYVAMLIVGLAFRRPFGAFVSICVWHIAMMAIHGIRAAWICATTQALEPRNVATGGSSAARRAGT